MSDLNFASFAINLDTQVLYITIIFAFLAEIATSIGFQDLCYCVLASPQDSDDKQLSILCRACSIGHIMELCLTQRQKDIFNLLQEVQHNLTNPRKLQVPQTSFVLEIIKRNIPSKYIGSELCLYRNSSCFCKRIHYLNFAVMPDENCLYQDIFNNFTFIQGLFEVDQFYALEMLRPLPAFKNMKKF